MAEIHKHTIWTGITDGITGETFAEECRASKDDDLTLVSAEMQGAADGLPLFIVWLLNSSGSVTVVYWTSGPCGRCRFCQRDVPLMHGKVAIEHPAPAVGAALCEGSLKPPVRESSDASLTVVRRKVSGVHAAMRSVAADTTPATVTRLRKALSSLPQLTDESTGMVTLAREMLYDCLVHPLFPAVEELHKEVNAMLGKGPGQALHRHPAMDALLEALGLCHAGGNKWEGDTALGRAWDRATYAGVDLLRGVSGYLDGGTVAPREVFRRLIAFSAAARRAVAYHARDVARSALVVSTWDTGLFVLGTRMSLGSSAWLRRIGRDTYRFDVTAILPETGTRHVTVKSFKTGKQVHDFPLSPSLTRRLAAVKALELI